MNKKTLIILMMILMVVISSCKVAYTKEIPEGYAKSYKTILVVYGDTLTSLAKEYCDLDIYDDIYQWMDEVKDMNHIEGDFIEAGQEYLIPHFHLIEVETSN